MYDVTITNVNTLVVTRKQVENPFDALKGIDWAELHSQHEVLEQIDMKITTRDGDILHIKLREKGDV